MSWGGHPAIKDAFRRALSVMRGFWSGHGVQIVKRFLTVLSAFYCFSFFFFFSFFLELSLNLLT